MGLLPNFFTSAPAAPGLIEELWAFAQSAYLDNPLPSLFKERLFVYLSRFCPVRYCIVRHAGFLMGLGRPAGDARALPQTVEQVMGLLSWALPNPDALNQGLTRLETGSPKAMMPDVDSPAEKDLVEALAVIFLEPRLAKRARHAVNQAYGERSFELLMAFLAFIRTAHYWTETHPELAYEPDMVALMDDYPTLAKRLLDIEAAESLAPRVILLDIGMPDMDGYETCRAIRQRPWGQAVIVIALTGYGQDEDRQRTQAAGFDGHLVKPVDLAVLLKLVTELLDQGDINSALDKVTTRQGPDRYKRL